MRARHSLPLTFAVLVVPLVASTATAGCSSRVQDCSELGPDWTACDGRMRARSWPTSAF
ncbi:MAG TPA: hypothetical protein PK141_11985 [Polyangiaceae bacterium]|nr:hypothetical protein [Polyangiaceae bacterium]